MNTLCEKEGQQNRDVMEKRMSSLEGKQVEQTERVENIERNLDTLKMEQCAVETDSVNIHVDPSPGSGSQKGMLEGSNEQGGIVEDDTDEMDLQHRLQHNEERQTMNSVGDKETVKVAIHSQNNKLVLTKIRSATERLHDTFVRFTDETTCHGLRNVFSPNQSKLRRRMWILIMMVCITVCVYVAASAVVTYFSFPANSAIQVHYVDELPFPAVTVCNVNPVKKSYYEESVENGTMFPAYQYSVFNVQSACIV